MSGLVKTVRRESSPVNVEFAILVVFLLLAPILTQPYNIILAIGATIALILTPFLRSVESPRRTRNAVLIVAGLVGLYGLASYGTIPAVAAASLAAAPLALAVAAISLWAPPGHVFFRWLGTFLLVAIVAFVGVISLVVQEPPKIDVLDLHVSAAETLVEGGNPYADARAEDTSPQAPPGAEVVGYPYPPLTMVPYVAAEVSLGDPRWASVIAMALAVLLIVRPWSVQSSVPAATLLAIGLAIVLQPALGHVLRQGWTEPIALPLLVGAGLLWRKQPIVAAVLLGLVFGLKQYWIVALPLLLAWDDEHRWKRFWIAGGVAALSLVPAFLAGPGTAWESLISDLLRVPARPDSIGLPGLGLNSSFWLVLLVSAAVAVWMARSGDSPGRFLLALAATLSIAFLMGTQAFVNYWFLIASMAMVALVVRVGDDGYEGDGLDLGRRRQRSSSDPDGVGERRRQGD